MNDVHTNPWAEINRLNATVAALKADKTNLALTNRALLEQAGLVELQMLRKLADTALATAIADSAYEQIEDLHFWIADDALFDAKYLLRRAVEAARRAFDEAVREYRDKLKGE